MNLVMDADCLIKLTRAGLKEHVCRWFTIAIPSRVRVEVVEQGSRHPESAVVARNLAQGLIREVQGPEVERGEEAAAELYRQGGFHAIASDDRRFVRRLHTESVPYLTPGVLLFLLARDGQISLAEAYRALARLTPMVSNEELAVVKMKLEGLHEDHAV